MMNYEKPILVKTEQMSEGVYLASGCYTVNANIMQKPETGRGEYRIQLNGKHASDHTKEEQWLTISFNQNVDNARPSNGTLLSGNGTNTLMIHYTYHQNPNDNIGLGDLIVEADEGLAITSTVLTD